MGSSLRIQLVSLPDQCLTRPCLAECVLGEATGVAIDGVDSSFHELCGIAFKTNPMKTLVPKTLVWLLSAVTYNDSLTTSQAEVPLE